MTVQDVGASVVVAQAATALDALHAVTVRTLVQPMCAPVPSLGRPEAAAWQMRTFELASAAEREASSLAGRALQESPSPLSHQCGFDEIFDKKKYWRDFEIWHDLSDNCCWI